MIRIYGLSNIAKGKKIRVLKNTPFILKKT